MTAGGGDGRLRLNGFDLLRAGGAFAVVWIHACDTSAVARRLSSVAGFAVPGFILMSFFLLQGKLRAEGAHSMGEPLRRRLSRLLPAYFGWTLIYLAARWAKHAGAGLAFEPEWLSSILLGGASYQLYFVPALIYWSVAILPLAIWCGRGARLLRGWVMVVVSLLLFGIVLGLETAPFFRAWPFGLRQIVSLAWLAPMGAAFGLLLPQGIQLCAGRRAWLMPAAAWAMVLLLAGAEVLGPVLYRLLVPLAVFLCALLDPGIRLPAWLMRLSTLSFGIYLCHGLWVEGLQMAAGRMALRLESFPMTLAIIVVSFLASWGLCELMDRLPRLKGLVR